ncbi:MAG: 2OG-Fe(II) oxygenase family protein [Chlamydiales bacterium]
METDVYRNNLKNRGFDKEAPQNSCPERVTIAERQGTSEVENSEGKPTKSKTDSSGCFGISDSTETLTLDIISYEDFIRGDSEALSVLNKALYEKGIVGMSGIPGYKEKVLRFIESAQAFSALPDEVKEAYGPNRQLGEVDLGYEKGKEKFLRSDGRWVVDTLKSTYSGFVPDAPQNKWPLEVEFKLPFQELGALMSDIGEAVMQKIGLVGAQSGIHLDGVPRKGRMLYYLKSSEEVSDNPLWCGSHFDHSLFTALLPGFYFVKGSRVAEPMEAGLFVKTTCDGEFKRVKADNPDILMFQVGEFGQLVTNDAIRATEHRVHKPLSSIERYTMALFFNAPKDAVIHSYSELANDSRYGGIPGEPCSFCQWQERSFSRYLANDAKSEDAGP